MSDFYKDVLTGIVFVTGVFGFVSGEFIISSTLFAAAAIVSSINMNHKRAHAGQLQC
jgi:CheY-specific phosphatase CheX